MPAFQKQLPDAAVAVARNRVRSGETLRAVARDLGVAHTTLARRFAQLDRRADADQALRDEARSIRAASPEVALGNRPEALPGERVLVPADIDRAVAASHALQVRKAAERSAREAEELSSDEHFTQWIERNDVASGRRTQAEVRADRASGRRAYPPEATRVAPFGPGTRRAHGPYNTSDCLEMAMPHPIADPFAGHYR